MNRLQNRVQLIGYVGADPEIITFTSGNKKANFSIATNRIYTDAKGETVEETEWHRVVVFGKMIEIVENFVTKGKQLGIEGRLSHRSYDATDGSKRYITEVVVEELLLLGGAQGMPVEDTRKNKAQKPVTTES